MWSLRPTTEWALVLVIPHSGASGLSRKDENALLNICCSAWGDTIKTVHVTVAKASMLLPDSQA